MTFWLSLFMCGLKSTLVQCCNFIKKRICEPMTAHFVILTGQTFISTGKHNHKGKLNKWNLSLSKCLAEGRGAGLWLLIISFSSSFSYASSTTALSCYISTLSSSCSHPASFSVSRLSLCNAIFGLCYWVKKTGWRCWSTGNVEHQVILHTRGPVASHPLRCVRRQPQHELFQHVLP